MSEETDNARPANATGNVMFAIREAVKVNVWLTGYVNEDVARIQEAHAAVAQFLAGLNEGQRADVMYVAPRGGGGGFGGRGGGGRAERYPTIEGMKCDKCDGPVGKKAKTGGMRNDSAVCLGSCKDQGSEGREFVHTVAWLKDDGTPLNAPKSKPALQPEQPKAQETAKPAGGEKTIGDFLNWCRTEHGLDRSKVMGILGVTDTKQITDLRAATRTVNDSMKAKA